MGEMKIFKHVTFGQVRIVDHEGGLWFIGMDVAKALGYADPSRAIIDHCKKSVKSTILVNNQYGMSTPLNLAIIPESDVYRLVMRSNLPNAEKFQDWVVEEVLPSIRKAGSYGIKMPQTYAEALRALADEVEAKEKAIAERDDVQAALGFAQEWRQVKGIPWLKQYFVESNMMYNMVGRSQG